MKTYSLQDKLTELQIRRGGRTRVNKQASKGLKLQGKLPFILKESSTSEF